MYKPLKDFVLVETIPLESTTASGLVIATSAKANHVPFQDGYVIDMGDDCTAALKALPARAKVMFRNFKEVRRWKEEDETGESKEFILIHEEDLVAQYLD